jgi:hypothetical protein
MTSGLPVRSALFEQLSDGLVVRRVNPSEYTLSYDLDLSSPLAGHM